MGGSGEYLLKKKGFIYEKLADVFKSEENEASNTIYPLEHFYIHGKNFSVIPVKMWLLFHLGITVFDLEAPLVSLDTLLYMAC